MNLSSLLELIRPLDALQELTRGDRTGSIRRLQVPRAARPPVMACLKESVDRPVVILVSRTDRLLTLAEELPAWSPASHPLTFPEPNPLFYEASPWGPRTIRQRMECLAALHSSSGDMPSGPSAPLILASARAVMSRTLPPDVFEAHLLTLEVGNAYRVDRLLNQLLEIGYQAASVVTQPGEFSRRGGILDLWPPAQSRPARIEFFGDQLDTLRSFDPETQRSAETLNRILVTPAREALPAQYNPDWAKALPDSVAGDPRPDAHVPYLEFLLPLMSDRPAGLLDYLPPGSLVLLDDRMAFEDAVDEFEAQAVALHAQQETQRSLPEGFPLPYLTLTELTEALDRVGAVELGMISSAEAADSSLGPVFEPGPRFGGQVRPLLDYLASRQTAHETCVLVSRQASRLAEIWNSEGGAARLVDGLPEDLLPGDLFFLQGALAEGWCLRGEGRAPVNLLTDAEIFGWGRPKPRARRPIQATAPEASFADLKPGDFVVHVDYGVGRLIGLVQRTLEGMAREYLLVEYGGGGQVYVPVHQADRLTRYVGVEGMEPHLSSLGSQEWDRVKSQAAEAVEEIARDLLDLYARRSAVQGYSYGADTEWQRELEASFPYVETDDQLRAIQSVKHDMESAQPMDRLICGDVGYGKTEVALRAAFKAVMEGRQVAMLVPTTILAQQHYTTFQQRLGPFPVKTAMLSRFLSRAEAQVVARQLSAGEVDIVIGTHRLLQKDIHFKDLGLLIIDEEQRFGVTHKEYLKRMRTEVDVLTLTATPIPRTLYMALAGARDISTINTPPEERLPVVTQVSRYDPRLIRQAVLRELDRSGQVFFVHNRVQTINSVARRLEHLLPEARLAVAHGQMPEDHLARVMQQFSVGEVDVLVSTSIIESGLDIPNANTLIVDRADLFGLAQLYQLRGRVGRSSARAYAYFLRHPQDHANEDSLRRLEIIAENAQLGAGYSIAFRDLEMRGAGDVLGTRQHGHIAAIGFHLYTRLLAGAVRRLREASAGPVPASDSFSGAREPLSVSIELPLSSAIPTAYIPERELRLQLYRRMAETRQLTEVDALQSELDDRFGPLPEEVANLLFQLRVRILAAQAEVDSITSENGQILLRTRSAPEALALPDLGPDVRPSRKGVWLARTKGVDWEDRLIQVLERLGQARRALPA